MLETTPVCNPMPDTVTGALMVCCFSFINVTVVRYVVIVTGTGQAAGSKLLCCSAGTGRKHDAPANLLYNSGSCYFYFCSPEKMGRTINQWFLPSAAPTRAVNPVIS